MSWAGNKTFKETLRGLFQKKGQAPFSSMPSPEDFAHTEALIQKWVNGKGYRMPDTNQEQVAERIGITPGALSRFFHHKNQDFRSWRTSLRIEDAKRQILEEPQTPFSVICKRVGISDRSNFSRQFKAVTGKTPGQWKNLQK